MSRVKEFEATGLAPNGRLYAGDLLAIQDHYADLSNFAQVVGVGTLQIGDTSLMVVKYGTGEFRMTGAVRTDGILRGLGGLYAGAFTTTQRDAIAVNLAPFGLIILNTTLARFQWNSGTDAARVWTDLSGDLANMPTAGQKAALAGTVGTPADSNRYVTAQGLAAVVGGGVIGVGSAAGGDLSGTYPNPAVKAASAAFGFLGDLTPPQITADQNDFNPSGISTASVFRLTSDAQRKLTGIAGGADGRLIIVQNVGTFPIIMVHESVLSSATNRFSLPNGADAVIGLNEINMMIYDSTVSRWRIAARNSPSQFIGAIVYVNAQQGIVSPNLTVINFGGEDFDTSGFHTGTSSQIVIPTGLAGYYEIVFYQACSSGPGIGSAIRKNGVDYLAFDSGNNTQNAPVGVPYSVGLPHCPFVQLNAGDYVEAMIMTSGTTNALARVGNNKTSGCWMSVRKIG